MSVETFHALRDRQTSDRIADPGDRGAQINLLNWDGKGRPAGLFPPPRETPPGQGDLPAGGGGAAHTGEGER